MFDCSRLLDFDIPMVRHDFGHKDTILYALSVGFGQDPLDERQLDFVDQHRRLVAAPSMAVILGYPGLWLARSGVDPKAVLHGEQEIEVVQPLPVSGTILAKTRVTGIIDKGPGKGALVLTEKQLTDEGTGETIATTRSTSFLRGYGGFGGPTGPLEPPHPVPDHEPQAVVDLPTRPEQALLYRLNGDDNSLHADPRTAALAGFERPILHGLCTFGVVCHALLKELVSYDAIRLTGLKLRFSAPVYPGETIRTEIWRCGSFRARVVERDVVVATNGFARVSQTNPAASLGEARPGDDWGRDQRWA